MALLVRIVSVASFAVVMPIVAYLAYPRALAAVSDLSADAKAAVAADHATIGTVVALAIAAVVVLRLARLGWQIAVLKGQRYRVTNQRLVIESGVLSRRIEEIDMRTVEDLAFHQSLLDRLLGVGTVVVVAADKTAGRHSLVGLSSPRQTRELIRSAAYQATRGQLFTRQT